MPRLSNEIIFDGNPFRPRCEFDIQRVSGASRR
jgi:hypothetical protein